MKPPCALQNIYELKELFTRRTFKAGGYTALACVVVLAIAVVAVLAMETLPTTWTKLDISEEGTTTLSDESKEKFSQLEDEFTIHCVCEEGEEDDYVQLEELNLLSEGDVPDDADAVAIVSPELALISFHSTASSACSSTAMTWQTFPSS